MSFPQSETYTWNSGSSGKDQPSHSPVQVGLKGVEFLRNVYAASGPGIKPKTRVSKIETSKEIIRGWGLNPEQILTREAFTEGARVYVNPDAKAESEMRILTATLKQIVREESARNGES